MTPKEKANELLNKYEKKLMYDYNKYYYKYNLEHCKQCALIVVDEVLGYMGSDRGYIFWEQVKKEIENL